MMMIAVNPQGAPKQYRKVPNEEHADFRSEEDHLMCQPSYIVRSIRDQEEITMEDTGALPVSPWMPLALSRDTPSPAA